jgi:uncharacterized membrane protein YkgB
MNGYEIGQRLERIGTAMLRYGLVAILLMIGTMKFTAAEVEAIQPWVANSPFVSWIYQVAGVQGGSNAIGCVEIVTALLIGSRRWLPRAAAIGSLLAVWTFLITLSFLVTTPNQSPDAQGFLLKDFFLLGAAVWSTGEALQAPAKRRAS